VALKTKMARLDHAGVDRPHRNLVNLLPLDAIIVHDSDHRFVAAGPAPRVVPRSIGCVKTHRLEPWMALEADATLLPDLALEKVPLRAIRRERRNRIGVQRRTADA